MHPGLVHVPPSQPHVIKVSRHRRHRSLDMNKHPSQSKTSKLSNSIVHTTIRSLNKDKSIRHQHSLQSNPVIVNNHHQSTVKCSKKESHPIGITKIRQPYCSPTQSRMEIMSNQNNQNNGDLTSSSSHQNDNSLKTNNNQHHRKKANSKIGSYLSKSTKLSHHKDMFSDHDLHGKIKTKEAWSDQKGMTEDHHRTSERKKKKLYRRIIVLLIAASIIGLVTAIILIAILSKSKTNIGINTVPILRWNANGITVAGITGVPGNASDRLRTPFGVTLDYPNAFYIADRGNNRVQKYLMGSSNRVTVAGQADASWNTNGSYLHNPSCVLVDSNENLYVTDSGNNRIQFWMKNSVSGTTVAGFGGYGSGSNQLSIPYGIARDLNSGTLYIADYANHRIMGYPKGALFGNISAGGNGNGTSNTQLYYPVGLHFDSFSNSLIIANHYAGTIVRWVVGASSWTLAAGSINGTSGNTSATLSRPTDVTFDPMGNMYVADRNNYRIQLFMIGETNAVTIAGVTGVIGNSSTLFNQPWSVKLDGQLNLYVADANNNRIQKFLRY